MTFNNFLLDIPNHTGVIGINRVAGINGIIEIFAQKKNKRGGWNFCLK